MKKLGIKCEFLGSGTSTGIPVIACDCSTCTSDDPRDKRLRSSILLTYNDKNLIIDTTTDFRYQALRSNIQRLDAILLTHNHADHVSGLDDIRPFCFKQGVDIPLFSHPDTIRWVRKRFDYIWEAKQIGGGLPKVELFTVEDGFEVIGLRVIPVPVMHGECEIYGYRIGHFAYISDVSFIPDSSYELLKGVKILVIDGLRRQVHRTHFNLEQAIEASSVIGAEKTWLTHISHGKDSLHKQIQSDMPENIFVAYDGLVLDI